MPENGFNWNDLENSWLWHSWDNYYNSGALYQSLAPGEVQFSEFSQQMLATMYQNHWNSEQERMKRMQAAGINPYSAAQGIAGVGGSQGSIASSPNSALGKGAETIASLGNTAANLMTAGGSSFSNVAQGISMLSKLRGEIDKIDSETQLNFENLGFTTLQSRALATQLKYMDYKERISCFQALANFENTKAEYNILKQDHLNKIAEFDKIIADTNVAVSMQEKIDAETQKIAEETAFIKQDVDFWSEHGYLRGSPFYESLRDAAVNNKPIDTEAMGDIVAGYDGKIYFARENAAAEASWYRRPSNAYEIAMWTGHSLGENLRNILSTNDAKTALNKIYQNVDVSAEFEEAYDEAKDELKANWRAAKKAYNSAKNRVNPIYAAELERRMNNAKEEYDSFTREKFTSTLVDIYTKKLQDVRK